MPATQKERVRSLVAVLEIPWHTAGRSKGQELTILYYQPGIGYNSTAIVLAGCEEKLYVCGLNIACAFLCPATIQVLLQQQRILTIVMA